MFFTYFATEIIPIKWDMNIPVVLEWLFFYNGALDEICLSKNVVTIYKLTMSKIEIQYSK